MLLHLTQVMKDDCLLLKNLNISTSVL